MKRGDAIPNGWAQQAALPGATRLSRRRWLAGSALLAGALRSPAGRGAPPATPAVEWPRDTGAHPGTRIEWWYVTGTLQPAGTAPAATSAALAAGTPAFGFQITFFRAATGLEPGAAASSAFFARDLLFAHAALSDVAASRHAHDQRIARPGFGLAAAETGHTAVRVRDWFLRRAPGEGPSRYRTLARSEAGGGFVLDLALEATQPPLLQGQGGLSRKGPAPRNVSRYYSEPQLAVRGTLGRGGAAPDSVAGRAWLDHEWSDALLPDGAVGWDWIGFNLDDGGALTAFRLRDAAGRVLWSGGSLRRAGSADVRDFAADEVRFTPLATWSSPASNATYPIAWQLDTPAGRHRVEALFAAQEMGALAGSGAVYWEGVSRLLDASGRVVGHGYLEMTGYAQPLRI